MRILLLCLLLPACRSTGSTAPAPQPGPTEPPPDKLQVLSLPEPMGPEPTDPRARWWLPVGETDSGCTIHHHGGMAMVGSRGPEEGIWLVSLDEGRLHRRLELPERGSGLPTGFALDGEHILVGDTAGYVHKVHSHGRVPWTSEPGAEPSAAPALGDMNQDGTPDVAVPAGVGGLVILDGATGEPLHEPLAPGAGSFSATPAMADVDADGRHEVFAPNLDGTMFALGGDGAISWRRSHEAPLPSSPILVDINRDGLPELIYVDGAHTVHAVDPRTGEPHWQRAAWDSPPGEYARPGPIGWHPTTECALVASAAGVACVAERGVIWTFTGGEATTGVVLGDLDGEPGIEVVVGLRDGRVVGLDQAGEIAWSYQAPMAVSCTPALVPPQEGRGLEILIADASGHLQLVTTESTALPRLPYHRGSPRNDGLLFHEP